MRLVIVSCAAGWLVLGCYPATHLQGPRTVAPGELQAVTALGVQSGGLPIDLGLRLGLHELADVSLRLRPLSNLDSAPIPIEAGAKLRVLREPVEVSLAAAYLRCGAGRWAFDDEFVTPDERSQIHAGRLTAFFGLSRWDDSRHAIWLAPTVDLGERAYPFTAGTAREPLFALGTTMGTAIMLGSQVQLIVEAGFMAGAVGPGRVTHDDGHEYQTFLGPGSVHPEASIGLLFGGDD